ncbi:hypothetical protein FB451DRAFT_1126546 [Mycena latifolia]|nr:hypothetical protein FB451DRAFT_1126546 [Mycena latifolia]
MITGPPLKDPQEADVIVNLATVPDDPPPAYFDSGSPSGSGSGLTSEPPAAPARVRPTNFLSLSRGDSPLNGSYVIDPRVRIPQSLLPPLASGETEAMRRNVLLQTTRGSIDVDLLVVGDATSKADILVKSSLGPITTRLHASTYARPPIHITAESSKAPITIYLPPTFCGPVTIRTGSSTVRFAGRLAEDVTMLSEADHTRRCFVGDFADWVGEEEWAGDALRVESVSGSVTVLYDDDAEDPLYDDDACAAPRPAFSSPFHARPHCSPFHFPWTGTDQKFHMPWMGMGMGMGRRGGMGMGMHPLDRRRGMHPMALGMGGMHPMGLGGMHPAGLGAVPWMGPGGRGFGVPGMHQQQQQQPMYHPFGMHMQQPVHHLTSERPAHPLAPGAAPSDHD